MDSKILGKVIDAAFFLQKRNVPNHLDFIESFRSSQIQSKTKLVDEICNFDMNWNHILVLGSWNSVLLYELFSEQANVSWFDFLDIDPVCHRHRDAYFGLHNMRKNYSNLIMDATEFSDFSKYDLIINTSCEHMKDIPAINGPLYALQSNNNTSIKEHINCVNSSKALAKQNNITDIRYHGTIEIADYERYTVIGQYW